MTDKLISDLTAIGAAIADNTAFEVQRNGQTTTEQALGSDLKTYLGFNGFGAPRTRFYAFTDCVINGNAGAIISDHFIENGGGAASGISSVSVGSFNALGIISLDLGTTTSGKMSLGSNVGTSAVILFGLGRARFQAKVAIPVLSNGTDTFTTRVGFIDNAQGEATDGAFFRYTDGVNSGKWQAVTRSNGTETATDTGVTVVAGTMQRFTIDVNAAGTSAVFTIDGANTITTTTNIPTGAGRETGYGVSGVKSVGTTATSGAYIDFIEIEQLFTSSR